MTAVLTPLRLSYPPALEPPYDDEYVDDRLRYESRTRGYAPLQPRLPCFTSGRPWTAPEVTTNPEPEPLTVNTFSRQSTPRRRLSDPEVHGRRFVQAFVEVVAGRRPLEQLVSWFHETLYFELVEQYGRRGFHQREKTSTDRQPLPLVTHVRACEPADGVAEVSAVVRERGRAFAVALRLEGLDGGWRCTSLTLV